MDTTPAMMVLAPCSPLRVLIKSSWLIMVVNLAIGFLTPINLLLHLELETPTRVVLRYSYVYSPDVTANVNIPAITDAKITVLIYEENSHCSNYDGYFKSFTTNHLIIKYRGE